MSDNISYQKYLFHQGKNYRSYEFMGAHPLPGKAKGVVFRVWAPQAEKVSLVAEFNGWNPEATPLTRLEDDPSIWEATVMEMKTGDLYKYAITADTGKVTMKADPFAFEAEAGSIVDGHQYASRVSRLAKSFRWGDKRWMTKRDKQNPYRIPMNIYEVHLGSWRRKEDGSYYTYRELADVLIPYVKEMGYTHMELLPVMEHPFDGSWGYQVTGYYSVTSRYGSPEDFKYFINLAHKNHIGVILDWVPAHFPKDEHGLYEFDGHPLYEDSMPTRMEHKGWGTRAFDFGRGEVLSFLISNAFFYCDVYHIDGIRIDAVAAMLYLDYDREDGEWMPNINGGRENLEAIHFLRQMNHDVLKNFPGVFTVAEESTAWPMVTKPPQDGGLGFNFKWNMGWMNDTLSYFETDPLFRRGSHNKLTFAITYAYSENFILPISHDEVVHGKRSMVDKMPGEYDNKFAGLRSFFVYMMTHPGKKLTFMGAEFGQFIEWNEKQELDWLLLDYDNHRKMQDFVRDLNQLYLDSPAIWETDDRWDGFRWIDADNCDDNVYTYLRLDLDHKKKKNLLIALNLSGVDYTDFWIGVPAKGKYTVRIDSDAPAYSGRGLRQETVYTSEEGDCNGQPQHISLSLPAFSGIVLEWSE